ncbi:uncharacterized protein LOC127535832 [Acanthochromis polyacanthus]|uniref:uncharacterized protein LOC127535832 n=1 Tax=Acanthochromis polyacanthus TaxID=80966 RepID=UPI002233E3B3|nr:uncharacterized protein LOC127535832 [Acanthochromis polyacanthus]
MSPRHGALHENSNQDDACTQVKIRQAPAVAIETETSPIHGASHEDSSQDDAHAQVTIRQAPAVAVETETSPIHGASHEDSSQDDAHAQVLTLVDYPLSDETDEDCIEDPLLNLHCNEMYRISDVCEPLFSSNESTVDETDEDSMKNYSGVHSEHNIVPKLRRTKSLLMDRIPDFSDALFDSSEDSSEGPSFKSERASRRLQPIHKSLVESSDSSVDSEDEYIPNPVEESTDSDRSLELDLKNRKSTVVSTSKRRSKPSKSSSQSKSKFSKSSHQSRSMSPSQSRSMSPSQSRRFDDFTQRFPESNAEVNKEQIAQTYTNKVASFSLSLEEESSVFVNPVLKKEDGSRRYNKKHHCYYCGQVVQKMSRHLLRRHQDKVEVAKVLSLPKNSKERRQQLDYIRNKGNFEHNVEVLENKKGKLIPWKT